MIRARRSASVLLAVVLVLLGCGKPSASREVADRFMDLYYARMNVAEAVKLCSGAARTRLEGELKAIQGVQPDAPSGEPRVTFQLTGGDAPSGTQATYVYRVTAHTAGVGNVVATLTLADDGGRWAVTSLKEDEGSPSS
jgi:hypothetical protein